MGQRNDTSESIGQYTQKTFCSPQNRLWRPREGVDSSFNLGAKWGGLSTPSPCSVTPCNETRYPLYKWLSGPESPPSLPSHITSKAAGGNNSEIWMLHNCKWHDHDWASQYWTAKEKPTSTADSMYAVHYKTKSHQMNWRDCLKRMDSSRTTTSLSVTSVQTARYRTN